MLRVVFSLLAHKHPYAHTHAGTCVCTQICSRHLCMYTFTPTHATPFTDN